jgi:hypothetical protein
MLPTLIEQKIRIIDVDVIHEEDGYYTVVSYSDGNYDEFGPYDTPLKAKSAVY